MPEARLIPPDAIETLSLVVTERDEPYSSVAFTSVGFVVPTDAAAGVFEFYTGEMRKRGWSGPQKRPNPTIPPQWSWTSPDGRVRATVTQSDGLSDRDREVAASLGRKVTSFGLRLEEIR